MSYSPQADAGRPGSGTVPARRPPTQAEARALASAVRLRILRLAFDAELTNKELAEALGLDPATVLHHVRTLVDTGFLEAGEPRRGRRGAREKPYRSTGKSWTIDIGVGEVASRTTSAMVQVSLDEVAAADPGRLEFTLRLALRLGAEGRAELGQRLQDVLDEFAARPPEPDGDPIAVFLVGYPRPLPPTATGAYDGDRAG